MQLERAKRKFPFEFLYDMHLPLCENNENKFNQTELFISK